MSSVLPKISFPELFFAIVSPIGTPMTEAVEAFEKRLNYYGYKVVNIRITDLFPFFEKIIQPDVILSEKKEYDRYKTYIEYGNQLRSQFSDDSILAVAAMSEILSYRTKLINGKSQQPKIAYVIRQFKRKEELELLRSVYGDRIFQISIYSHQSARVENLAEIFAKDDGLPGLDSSRPKAEEIVNKDRDDVDKTHGQQIGKIFHDADFIVNVDKEKDDIEKQINRFSDLLFGANNISPNRDEYGLRLATNAALRSIDLSRQVGAAIFDSNNQIVSLGSNEVPKAGGGTYWCDDGCDAREYTKKEDSNVQRKNELLSEVVKRLGLDANEENLEKLQNIQFMDALEYGRVVHAEMSALSDAARSGRAVNDGILYCTTFPCHMCAKHIVAAGIKRVIFLEPYPKSLVSRLHQDAIEVEQKERGKYKEYPKVTFEHFYGVTPRRFDTLFKRGSRKDHITGKYQDYSMKEAQPIISVRSTEYFKIEAAIVKNALDFLFNE